MFSQRKKNMDKKSLQDVYVVIKISLDMITKAPFIKNTVTIVIFWNIITT